MNNHILVVASTFPANDSDPVPAFVKEQVIALKNIDPKLRLSVLAPHDNRSGTQSFSRHEHYDEYRFHYFWPRRFERLAGRGILPALKQNKFNYFLIPFLFIGELVALYVLTRRIKPDLMYAHWFTPQAIVANWVRMLTGIPFVFTTHASDVSVLRKLPILGKWLVKNTTHNAKAFTAVSSQTMSKLEQFFNKDELIKLRAKSSIIPMGIDVEKFNSKGIDQAALKKKYGFEGKKVILFMGRLAEKKGVTYLLQAYAQLKDPNALLVIAGDGPLKESLESEAQDLGIADNTAFVGFVSGEEKLNYLHLSDIFVVPSIITKDGDQEGLPVALMEGMAAGKTCIATHESGASDIIKSGELNLLIPHKNPSMLSDAIMRALHLPHAESSSAAQKCKDLATRLSWPEVGKKHLNNLLD